jgi:predicted HTH transcriptional regulator
LGELGGRWYLIGLAALSVLSVGISLALLVVRKYSRRLRELPKLSIDPAHPEADLRELIAEGEGAHLEFKSTMRMNLRTQANGKEIELAWLKGVTAFLNREGGIVLLGVGDDGRALGLAADRFETEDRCRLHFKNLLSQHLGPEYARFVRFDIHDLEGLRIGAVECERADAPAFLRYDGKGEKAEAFIIRSGPSNLELSVSRAMRYIRGRF